MSYDPTVHLPEGSGNTVSPDHQETHRSFTTSESLPSSGTNSVSCSPFGANEFLGHAGRSYDFHNSPNYDEQSIIGANSSLRSLWDSSPMGSTFVPAMLSHPGNSGYWQCNLPENLCQNPASLMIPTPSIAADPARASFSPPPGFLPNCGCPGKPWVSGFPDSSRPNRINLFGFGVGCDYSAGEPGIYSGSMGVIHYPADQPVPFSHPGGLWQELQTHPPKPKSRRITRQPKPGLSFYCGFCMKNKERPEVYRSHNLKVFNAEKNAYELQCPVLRGYCCPICHATGDDAHTITYCPKIIDNVGRRPVSIVSRLKQSDHNSAGYKRSDARKPFNNKH